MISVCIEAKRPEYDDWRVRSRLSDVNYELHGKKINLETALSRAYEVMCGWINVEPLTEYKIGVVISE